MAKTKTMVKTKPEIPAKVNGRGVTVLDMQGWRKREVEAALDATGMHLRRAYRFTELWEVVKPKHVHAESDNEARGILAQSMFLNPYCQDITGEVRHLYDWASRYMTKRIDVGDEVSTPVFRLWHTLRWMLIDWQVEQKRNGQES